MKGFCLTCVVRLHGLYGMGQGCSAIHPDFARRSHEASLCLASRPEGVSYVTPWLFWILAIICCAVLSDHETRGELCDGDVYDALCAS